MEYAVAQGVHANWKKGSVDRRESLRKPLFLVCVFFHPRWRLGLLGNPFAEEPDLVGQKSLESNGAPFQGLIKSPLVVGLIEVRMKESCFLRPKRQQADHKRADAHSA